VVENWDLLRRRLATWISLVNIRFSQDTRNEEYIRAREYCDGLEPKLTNLATSLKRRLVESVYRPAIEERFGRHVFDLWKCDIAGRWRRIAGHSKCLNLAVTLQHKGVCDGKEVGWQEWPWAAQI
jgi:hypothetical protein